MDPLDERLAESLRRDPGLPDGLVDQGLREVRDDSRRTLADFLVERGVAPERIAGAAVDDPLFGRVAVRLKLISDDDLSEALNLQALSPQKPRPLLGQILLQLGKIDTRQFLDVLREQKGVEPPRRRIGRYDVLETLGEGGMGVVLRGRDPELGRDVAIKVLREGDSASRRAIERFHREAEAIARLKHPNIVTLFEAGRDGETLFFAMEYVDGVPMDRLLEQRRLERRRAVEILAEVAEAVQYAHDHGIVHRDLKPANIVVDREGRARILDFGLSRHTDSHGTLTRSGAVVGTPMYMAPEQARGSTRDINARTDVYALGVTLYEILTGGLPFAGSSPGEIYSAILSSDPKPISGDVPRDLRIVCLKAMAREQERRYAGARELAEDLRRHLAGEPIAARPPGVVYRARRWFRRHGVLAAAAAAVAVVAVGVTLFTRARAYERSRAEAKRAYEAGEWPKALVEAERALGMRHDAELAAIASGARARIAEAEAEKRRLEDYERLQQALQPYERVIQETRALFYVPRVRIRDKLDDLEKRLEELEKIASDPAHAPYADPWTLLGVGWYLAGDTERAEGFLAKAAELAPDEGLAHFHLARICLERSLECRVVSETTTEMERQKRAAEWTEKARAHLRRPAKGWSGAKEIDRHLLEGYRAYADGDGDRVRSICEEGLKRYGDELGSEEYWNLRALADGGAGRIEACAQAIGRRAHYAWAYYVRGTAYHARKQDALAIADFTTCLGINPRMAGALYNRGVARSASGDLAGAIEDYERCLLLRPGEVEARNNRGALRHERGDLDGALADLDEVIRRSPTYVNAYVNRGRTRRAKGDLKGALADYDEAIRLKPGFALAWYNRGNLFFDAGQNDRAIADFTKSIEHDPRYAASYNNRANAKSRKGDPKGAMADFDEAIKIDPNYDTSHNGRGLTRETTGDLEGARADYDAAIRINPKNCEALNNRAVLRKNGRDFEGALADWAEALKVNPNYASAYFNRGHFRWSRGETDLAIADLDAFIRLEPNDPDGWSFRGNLKQKKGDLAGAVADYEKSLEVAPKNWRLRGMVEGLLKGAKKKRADKKD